MYFRWSIGQPKKRATVLHIPSRKVDELMKESMKDFDPSLTFYNRLLRPGVMIGKFLSKWEVIHKKCIFENEKLSRTDV